MRNFERRKSKAAIWCLRLAVLAVPYFIIVIFLHRNQQITSEQAFWFMSFGIAMVVISILFGLHASVELWRKGYKGGSATVRGIAICIFLLMPFGYQLVLAVDNPQLNDLATDVINPPAFITDELALSKKAYYDDYESRIIVSAYPQIVSRRYQASPERVVEGVQEILELWSWPVIASINLPEIEDTQSEEQTGDEEEVLEGGQNNSSDSEDDLLEDLQDTIIESQAYSTIMALKSNVVIRISSDEGTTIVDMRSASDWAPHDFGSNAEHIVSFLEHLDTAFVGVSDEN